MLKHRLASGSMLVILLFLLAWLDDSIADGTGVIARGLLLAILAGCLVAPILALETSLLLKRAGVHCNTMISSLGAAFLCLGMWWSASEEGMVSLQIPSAVMVIVLFVAFLDATRGRSPKGVIGALAGSVFTVAYTGGLLGFWLLLREYQGAWVVLGAILVVKMTDIGAYAVGCSIGQNKLIPWLSPKKTWEGLLGGVVAGAISGLLLAWFSQLIPGQEAYPPLLGAIFGVAAGFIGLAGDLLASALKRDAGVKDSSAILPGLGGALDTMDSLLLVGPLAWWLLG